MASQAALPSLLNPDDPDPIVYQEAMVRYLREPHLSDFLSGLISFASAADYRTALDEARRDDEHVRPFAIFPNQKVTIGGNIYPATTIRMQRTLRRDESALVSYHIASFSAEQSFKLAREFSADGAVLMRDYQRFFGLLEAELKRAQPRAWIDLKNGVLRSLRCGPLDSRLR